MNNRYYILFIILFISCRVKENCFHISAMDNSYKIDSLFCNDQLMMITTNYFDSIPDSVVQVYSSDRKLESTTRYFMGKLHGLQEYYYNSGYLMQSSYFELGKKSVEEIEYFENLWEYPDLILNQEPEWAKNLDSGSVYKVLRPKRHTLFLNGEPEFEMTFNAEGFLQSIHGQPILINKINDTLYYIEKIELYYSNYSVDVYKMDGMGIIQGIEEVENGYEFSRLRNAQKWFGFSIQSFDDKKYNGNTIYTIYDNGVINRKYEIIGEKMAKKYIRKNY
ncbi:MAG: hypothetical protein IPG60_06645 [Bacteroidetes bacterium]|nr:hypothetical protein [Bacteroidota bacterium]MBK7110411.1 hypothetical protein [Bacteroidota bacterium]